MSGFERQLDFDEPQELPDGTRTKSVGMRGEQWPDVESTVDATVLRFQRQKGALGATFDDADLGMAIKVVDLATLAELQEQWAALQRRPDDSNAPLFTVLGDTLFDLARETPTDKMEASEVAGVDFGLGNTVGALMIEDGKVFDLNNLTNAILRGSNYPNGNGLAVGQRPSALASPIHGDTGTAVAFLEHVAVQLARSDPEFREKFLVPNFETPVDYAASVLEMLGGQGRTHPRKARLAAAQELMRAATASNFDWTHVVAPEPSTLTWFVRDQGYPIESVPPLQNALIKHEMAELARDMISPASQEMLFRAV